MTGPNAVAGRGDRAVLGLDIGGTKLAAGVVDSAGHIRSFASAATPAGWQPAVQLLLALGDQALVTAGLPRAELEGVGIGCGGPLNIVAGTVSGPPNLPGWEDVPVVNLVYEHFGRPTVLENDGSAAALATHRWGRWAGTPNLVYLTISSGIGSGVIIGGELFRGAAGNGGEIGHSLVDWKGRLCGCGHRGCAEAYVSGHSIARRTREAIAAGRLTAMSTGAGTTARDVAAAAAAGDPLAGAIWDETTAILGRVVASALNMFEPELVVLGGGVAQAGAMLIDPVRTAALAQAMPPAARAADVVLSSHGHAVGVLGAAAAVLLTGGASGPDRHAAPTLQGAKS